MKGNRDRIILACSNELFLEYGYRRTTMRQIAERADTSLGLATYHYKSKRQLAVKVMELYLRYLRQQVDKRVSSQAEPLIHSAAMVRLCIEFFLSHPCRQFYLECLEYDIYMESIQRLGNAALHDIAKAHHVDMSSDLMLLYDNYIPPSVEKILILEKGRGNFSGISYDDIPDIVFSISVDRHIGQEAIARAAAGGREAAREALAAIPLDITSTLLAVPDYLYQWDEYSKCYPPVTEWNGP